jgi:hypothetical protein
LDDWTKIMSLLSLRSRKSAAVSVLMAAALVALPVATAQAAIAPISGSTAWGPCDWYTSSNVRYTSVAGKTVRANLTSTGKLGVKMRTLNVNTGATSVVAYFPPLNTWQKMGYFSAKSSPFRLQFTCVNPRSSIFDRPSTNFDGSLDY